MKVGFVGLGIQGKGLALNEAAAGFELSVFDLSAERCAELVAAGARAAPSSADVAEGCQVIQVCVLDDAQLHEVVAGPWGLLAGAPRGAVIAVHSTVRPDTVQALADLAQGRGVTLIDAPVSGGAAGAAARRMSFMVGGPAEALEICRPVLLASGPRITHIGPLGSGLKAKLAHQVVLAINLMAAYEGMRLGTAAGLPPALLEQVVREGGAHSVMASQWSSLFLGPAAPAVFYKDLQLCIELGRSLGMSMPATALCQQLLDTILAEHRVPPQVGNP